MSRPQVAVIMGSDSDLPVMQPGIDILHDFGVKTEIKIVSAHRTPEFMQKYAKSAAKRGIQVIIAGAGGAAHLPGMVASLALIPVIGVPVELSRLKGLDSLLSIVQMPRGVPVATVGVDNSTNAGLLAIRILALGNSRLLKKLDTYSRGQKSKVDRANRILKRCSLMVTR